jgi:hypothetical protein
MVSRTVGRFLATSLLTLVIWWDVLMFDGYLKATDLFTKEVYFALVFFTTMIFFWLFFTVIDSLVVLAVPPQRTAPPR